MNNNFYTLFQYFTGRVSLRDNEFTFYSLFQNDNNLTDECTVIDKVGILLKQTTYGCMILYDDKKKYDPNEIETNKKFSISLFQVFTDCAAHISAFNTNFNNVLNRLKDITHFFAWIYLPSEKVIRCFNKNCIVKTNSNHTITALQFFDIPITSLNYLAYAAHSFDIDSVTDAIESIITLTYDFPVSCVKFVPKTALSQNEINSLTTKYRFFYKINEIESLGEKITDDEIYLKHFQHLKILEATKDNNLNSYFIEHFLNKKEIYEAVIARQVHGKQLKGSFENLYEAILENYQEAYTKQPPTDFSNYWLPYSTPFKGYSQLEKIINSWSKTINNEDQANNMAKLLYEKQGDISLLKQTIQKLKDTKLTPYIKILCNNILTSVNNEMTFDNINSFNAQLENIVIQNQTEYPIWYKEQQESNKIKRKKFIKFAAIIGALVLLIITYNNYDYEIEHLLSSIFTKKKYEKTDTVKEEVSTNSEVPTDKILPAADTVEEAEPAQAPTQLTNETITIHGETFIYTGEAYLNDTINTYMPFYKGKAVFKNHPEYLQYVGEYRYGYRTGKGTMTYNNNDTYIGGFKQNNFEGEGIYTFAKDGDYYKGEFHEGTFHGNGAMYHKNGKLYQSGTYRNGEYIITK